MASEGGSGRPGRLDGRVAIVTGAGRGIGRGIARAFAAEGATVLVAEIDAEAGALVADELRAELGADARSVRTDVHQKSDVVAMVQHAVDTWGTVDILVNNAFAWSGSSFCRVEDKDDDTLANALSSAYYGPFWAMQAAYPVMKAQRWGRVINVCSLAGVLPFVGLVDYNAAKEALRTLTRTAAREWAPYGVVANVVCPGAKTTGQIRQFAEHPELEREVAGRFPMRRLGDPETDIGPVAVFLASDDARYLTGNTLHVDGGGHIGGVAWDGLPDEPETYLGT
jgi:NAD(P)-dependent dehydrogenase (short-subunit alcohol dehydrogenase family)